MAKLAKHLQAMEPQNLARLQEGFSRFRFGFAQPGEEHTIGGDKYTFLGDFGVKKVAEQTATDKLNEIFPDKVYSKELDEAMKFVAVKVHPYLNGKRKVGWTVWLVNKAEPTPVVTTTS